MSITIEELHLGHETHDLYKVTFDSQEIETIVTRTPSIVDSWISNIQLNHQSQPGKLMVGLDVEWRPNNRRFKNPVAILQLCVDSHCLIFQILHSPNIPQSLVNFLNNSDNTFVGVCVEADVAKLLEDYGLRVAKTVDLRGFAARKMGVREFEKAGLKTLGKELLGKEIEKSKRVTLSRWDDQFLTYNQV